MKILSNDDFNSIKKGSLLTILFILSIVVLLTITFFNYSIFSIEQTVILLILEIATAILLVSIKSVYYKKTLIEKICNKYNIKIIDRKKSLHQINKKELEIFNNHHKSLVLLHAQKKINKIITDLYYIEDQSKLKKEILLLEFSNLHGLSNDFTIISQELNNQLKLKTFAPRSKNQTFNIRFQVSDLEKYSEIFSKINIQLLLDFSFPIGIISHKGKLLIFTTGKFISSKNFEKIWKILDSILIN